MEFDLDEVIKIAEYVRAGHDSTPTVKTKTLVDEYLNIKNSTEMDNAINWWNDLANREKWNKTINHAKHWEVFTREDIYTLWLSCGYGK